MSQRLLMMSRAAALTEKAAVVVALSRSSNLIIWGPVSVDLGHLLHVLLGRGGLGASAWEQTEL